MKQLPTMALSQALALALLVVEREAESQAPRHGGYTESSAELLAATETLRRQLRILTPYPDEVKELASVG